jgi:hypothetical protein
VPTVTVYGVPGTTVNLALYINPPAPPPPPAADLLNPEPPPPPPATTSTSTLVTPVGAVQLEFVKVGVVPVKTLYAWLPVLVHRIMVGGSVGRQLVDTAGNVKDPVPVIVVFFNIAILYLFRYLLYV